MRLKLQQYYWSIDLLDYFIGTDQNHDKWVNRSEIREWMKANAYPIKFRHNICLFTDNPHSGLTPKSAVIEEFFNKALEEFGEYDYEFNESRPCGGWKYLNIIVC